MGFVTATADLPSGANFTERIRLFRALGAAGFRRYATYRQATVAAVVTNSMFGFLRTYVMLAVAANAGTVAGYSGPQLVTYVWAGQGLIGVVALWGWTDLADRIRSGDVVADLLRPVDPISQYLATDLGRAGYAALTRLAVPLLTGALCFDMYLPRDWWTWPLFAVSTVLAVVVCYGCRFLVNAATYWLLDSRGVMLLWAVLSGLLGGLYVPIRFLPEPLPWIAWLGTPGPSLLQAPLDVLTEVATPGGPVALVAVQAAWAVVMLALCWLVQTRAERKLVVQGG